MKTKSLTSLSIEAQSPIASSPTPLKAGDQVLVDLVSPIGKPDRQKAVLCTVVEAEVPHYKTPGISTQIVVDAPKRGVIPISKFRLIAA